MPNTSDLRPATTEDDDVDGPAPPATAPRDSAPDTRRRNPVWLAAWVWARRTAAASTTRSSRSSLATDLVFARRGRDAWLPPIPGTTLRAHSGAGSGRHPKMCTTHTTSLVVARSPEPGLRPSGSTSPSESFARRNRCRSVTKPVFLARAIRVDRLGRRARECRSDVPGESLAVLGLETVVHGRGERSARLYVQVLRELAQYAGRADNLRGQVLARRAE